MYIHVSSTNCSLSIIRIKRGENVSMFHFLCVRCWLLKLSEGETYCFQCFIYVSFYVSVFHFLVFRYNLKISRGKNENMLEEKSKLARSDFKTCSKRCDWNTEFKAETSACDVSVLQLIDYQCFQIENWNMKQNKPSKVNSTYARAT